MVACSVDGAGSTSDVVDTPEVQGPEIEGWDVARLGASARLALAVIPPSWASASDCPWPLPPCSLRRGRG